MIRPSRIYSWVVCLTVLCSGFGLRAAELPVIYQKLVAPPSLPAPITRKTPARVVIDLTVEETEREIAPGTRYTFWTFGGTVPGNMIRVREGDTVELHLRNLASNKLPHNIDLHAVSGPGGGAPQTLVAPGKEARFSFKALHSGLFVYHCATTPVGMHVANGMYGMILVEPKTGLSKVDHEYYVMQGDFYTSGAYRAGGLQPFDMQKAIDEKPTYVLFNGADGALTGEHALKAKTGDKIRLFFGDGGPNLTSSFHVIGAIMDRVYSEGGTRYSTHVQTTMVPAGGSAMIEFTTPVPGNLTLVDHSLTRAFNKGAVALISVSGPERPDLYSKGVVTTIGGAVSQAPVDPSAVNAEPPGPHRVQSGKQIFENVCAACHQAHGQGIAGVFPPLANSDFFKQHPAEAARVVMGGRAGEITVNGQRYNSVMPPQELTDHEVAAVLNYVSIELNAGAAILTSEQVRGLRSTGAATK